MIHQKTWPLGGGAYYAPNFKEVGGAFGLVKKHGGQGGGARLIFPIYLYRKV